MRTIAFAGAALALTAAGCGGSVEIGGSGFDQEKAEQTIRDAVERDVGAQVRDVRCPTAVTMEKGKRVTCTVVGLDGSEGPAYLTFKNDDGDVRASAPLLHIREAEQAISGQIAAKLGGQVLVTCPEIIQVVKGREFRCKATKGGDSAPVHVVLTDGAGHFRYRLVTGSSGPA